MGLIKGAIKAIEAAKAAGVPVDSGSGNGMVARAVMAARNASAKKPPSMSRMNSPRMPRMKDGGSVSSNRGDGIAVRGKTKCKMY